jgi:S1-C subfamily serine protease
MSSLSGPPSLRPRPAPTLRSVVKVHCVADPPDYEQPWQTRGATSVTGSGAVVETPKGPHILTNAHVVENHTYVAVRRYGRSQRIVAEVVGVDHACDLALLQIADPEFYEGTQPLVPGRLPTLTDRVAVCGYPIGGDRLSVTEGVVSRVEMFPYAQSQRPLLAIQLDAAINSGNSGGPVFRGEQMVGIAFQSLEEAESIAYAIATPVVHHFLRDVCGGKEGGFPDLGINWQPLESNAHRRYLGLSAKDGGVLITRVDYENSSWGVLHEGDVLLGINGEPVAADGTVPLRGAELIDHSYLVSMHFVGQRLPVVVWRAGKRKKCRVPLRAPRRLVPEDRYDVRPTYYLFGGLLFIPLTRDYLKAWGTEWWRNAPDDLMTLYENGFKDPKRLEVVVLQKVLADRVNQGYHELENLAVTHVNNRAVKDLRDLVNKVERARDAYVRIRVADGRQIVLDREGAIRRNPTILRRYSVPHDRSIDLRGEAPESHGRPAHRTRRCNPYRPS